jgi:hypothetical protein
MTLVGVLFVIAEILRIPGNCVYAVAKKLFELIDGERA